MVQPGRFAATPVLRHPNHIQTIPTPSGAAPKMGRSLPALTNRAIAAGHDIHPAMRALSMPMHPDKLFRLAACRTAGQPRGCALRLDAALMGPVLMGPVLMGPVLMAIFLLAWVLLLV